MFADGGEGDGMALKEQKSRPRAGKKRGEQSRPQAAIPGAQQHRAKNRGAIPGSKYPRSSQVNTIAVAVEITASP